MGEDQVSGLAAVRDFCPAYRRFGSFCGITAPQQQWPVYLRSADIRRDACSCLRLRTRRSAASRRCRGTPDVNRGLLRRAGRREGYAFITASTRSGNNGECLTRAPVSAATALLRAGPTNGVAICPTPVG